MVKDSKLKTEDIKLTAADYYSLDKILSKKADVMLIWGQRGNGKSYSALKYCLDVAKSGKQFVYARRFAEDIKDFRMSTVITPLNDMIPKMFGKDYSITYYRRKFYLVDPDGKKERILGHALSLSDAGHDKSTSYPDVDVIVLDEFLPLAGDRVVSGEMEHWDILLSTVIRTRQNVKVFLLGNALSRFSPFFIRYGINPTKMSQGEILVKDLPTDSGILRVAAEYCKYNPKIAKLTSKYIASNSSKSGEWEIKETDDVPYTEGEVVKERLLFTMYNPDSEFIVGCFWHLGKFETLELNKDLKLYERKLHKREFLVIRPVYEASHYFHLSNEKSLSYTVYNNLDMMLDEIEDTTGIDVEREMNFGRIYSQDMFIADEFWHCWDVYDRINPRYLL